MVSLIPVRENRCLSAATSSEYWMTCFTPSLSPSCGVASSLDYLTVPCGQSLLLDIPWRRIFSSRLQDINNSPEMGLLGTTEVPPLHIASAQSRCCTFSWILCKWEKSLVCSWSWLSPEATKVLSEQRASPSLIFLLIFFHYLPTWGLNILLAFHFADAIIGLPCVW